MANERKKVKPKTEAELLAQRGAQAGFKPLPSGKTRAQLSTEKQQAAKDKVLGVAQGVFEAAGGVAVDTPAPALATTTPAFTSSVEAPNTGGTVIKGVTPSSARPVGSAGQQITTTAGIRGIDTAPPLVQQQGFTEQNVSGLRALSISPEQAESAGIGRGGRSSSIFNRSGLDTALHQQADISRARRAQGRGLRRRSGGTAPGSRVLQDINKGFDRAIRNTQGDSVGIQRIRAGLEEQRFDALSDVRTDGSFNRRTDVLSEGTEADVLRTQLQQQGANQRFAAGQSANQAATDLEGFRRFANITVSDKEGNRSNFEDIGGLNQVADMFGGEQATMQLLKNGGLSQGLLSGLVKLRSNLNNSASFREQSTNVRNLPEFRSDEARFGDFFNNGIGILDILLGREVLRSDGNPSILFQEAFEGTGLTADDIATLVQQLKQGN